MAGVSLSTVSTRLTPEEAGAICRQFAGDAFASPWQRLVNSAYRAQSPEAGLHNERRRQGDLDAYGPTGWTSHIADKKRLPLE